MLCLAIDGLAGIVVQDQPSFDKLRRKLKQYFIVKLHRVFQSFD
jgi:hypothetical protein